MCDVYHYVGILTTYGLTVALGCLLVHLLAFLLLEDCVGKRMCVTFT